MKQWCDIFKQKVKSEVKLTAPADTTGDIGITPTGSDLPVETTNDSPNSSIGSTPSEFIPNPAPVWARVIAASLDLFLVSIIISVLFMVQFVISAYIPQSHLYWALARSLLIVVPFVYFAGFENTLKQATPGQLMFNIRVTNDDGKRIGIIKSTFRLLVQCGHFVFCSTAFILTVLTAASMLITLYSTVDRDILSSASSPIFALAVLVLWIVVTPFATVERMDDLDCLMGRCVNKTSAPTNAVPVSHLHRSARGWPNAGKVAKIQATFFACITAFVAGLLVLLPGITQPNSSSEDSSISVPADRISDTTQKNTAESNEEVDADLVATGNTVVYAIKNIKEGEEITEDALEEEKIEPSKIPSDAIGHEKPIVGRVAKYGISSGQIVSIHDLLPPGCISPESAQKALKNGTALPLTKDDYTFAPKTGTVWIAQITIPRGTPIEDSSFVRRQVDPSMVPEQAISDFEDTIGTFARYDIPDGQILTAEELALLKR